MTPKAWVSAGLVAGGLVGCKGEASHGETSPELIFDQTLGSYVQVRDCRYPGEHSALSAFTVWVSRNAYSAFGGLFADPPTETRLPPDAVVVKAVYEGTECDASRIDRWVAMRKEPGFDPEHADWHWQEVTAEGQVVADGADADCINCHRGTDDTTCIGYGEANGLDYVCTAE